MPKPSSYDLRQKVIQAIELDGMKKGEAATVFQVSRNTIHLWLERKASSGDYQAKPNQPPGNGHKITDWDKFTAFVRDNGDQTQVEMAQLWDEPISDRTISSALDKIGFSRKKRMHISFREATPTRTPALALACRRHRRIEDGLLSVRCTKQKLMDIRKGMKKKGKNFKNS